jgi:outer membrane protein OmpU
MKKILLATTVLAMSAGFAAADVSVSGDGRMGIVSSDGVSTLWNRMRIKFSGSGTTDGGLSFGGSFRAGEAGDADENSSSKGSVFISGAFGKMTMGSVDSGDSAVVGQLASVGFTGLGSGNSISYAADGGVLDLNDNDSGASARVLYTYSGNGLTVAASSAQLTDGGNSSYGVGVSYTTGALTLALGTGQVDGTFDNVGRDTGVAGTVEDVDGDVTITDTSFSATYVMGTTTIKAIYQDKSATLVGDATDNDADIDTSVTATSMGMSVSHAMDAITLTAYTVTTEIDAGDLTDDNPTATRYGIGASYNLGGGASVTAGWAALDTATFTDDTDAGNTTTAATYTTETINKFDLGLNFSF